MAFALSKLKIVKNKLKIFVKVAKLDLNLVLYNIIKTV